MAKAGTINKKLLNCESAFECCRPLVIIIDYSVHRTLCIVCSSLIDWALPPSPQYTMYQVLRTIYTLSLSFKSFRHFTDLDLLDFLRNFLRSLFPK